MNSRHSTTVYSLLSVLSICKQLCGNNSSREVLYSSCFTDEKKLRPIKDKGLIQDDTANKYARAKLTSMSGYAPLLLRRNKKKMKGESEQAESREDGKLGEREKKSNLWVGQLYEIKSTNLPLASVWHEMG